MISNKQKKSSHFHMAIWVIVRVIYGTGVGVLARETLD